MRGSFRHIKTDVFQHAGKRSHTCSTYGNQVYAFYVLSNSVSAQIHTERSLSILLRFNSKVEIIARLLGDFFCLDFVV
jgi:hypothetical protein